MRTREAGYSRGLMLSISVTLVGLIAGPTFARAWSLFALLGIVATVAGLASAAWFGYRLARERYDSRYDLNRLFDEEPAADETDDDGEALYCERCGIGYPIGYPACPSCGLVNRRHV